MDLLGFFERSINEKVVAYGISSSIIVAGGVTRNNRTKTKNICAIDVKRWYW